MQIALIHIPLHHHYEIVGAFSSFGFGSLEIGFGESKGFVFGFHKFNHEIV
jgi:hypothetical protein